MAPRKTLSKETVVLEVSSPPSKARKFPVHNSSICGISPASRFTDFTYTPVSRPVFIGRSDRQHYAPRSGYARQASNLRQQAGGSDQDDDGEDDDLGDLRSGGGGGGAGGGGGGNNDDGDPDDHRNPDSADEDDDSSSETLVERERVPSSNMANYLPLKINKRLISKPQIKWRLQLPKMLHVDTAPADWRQRTVVGRWMERARSL